MVEFFVIACIAYTIIDLTCALFRHLPDWLAYDETKDGQ
jgi:hypothetical protein